MPSSTFAREVRSILLSSNSAIPPRLNGHFRLIPSAKRQQQPFSLRIQSASANFTFRRARTWQIYATYPWRVMKGIVRLRNGSHAMELENLLPSASNCTPKEIPRLLQCLRDLEFPEEKYARSSLTHLQNVNGMAWRMRLEYVIWCGTPIPTLEISSPLRFPQASLPPSRGAAYSAETELPAG